MNSRVVVTGASGFVGAFLVHWLADRGFVVTAIARGAIGRSRPGVVWRRIDLAKLDALRDDFDVLIHCAAETPSSCADPAALYDTNLRMAKNLFFHPAVARARAVVFLSSVSVYGTIGSPVVTEETVSVDPDAYGRAKHDAEDMLAAAVRLGLASGLTIRLPGTVGKGSHDNFLSNSLRRVIAGEPVVADHPDALFNAVVYVGDLARFVTEWIESPRAGYGVTNLAATHPRAIREVLSMLVARVGRPTEIVYRAGGKTPFLISLEQAYSLGYKPASVEASIASFVRDATNGPTQG